MKLKGRVVPDPDIELAPYIVDIPLENGKTQLMVLEPERKVRVLGPEKYPERPIENFSWSWPEPEPKKKEKGWVMAVTVAALVSCAAAAFGLMIAPILSTVIILADLAWMGIVAFANR